MKSDQSQHTTTWSISRVTALAPFGRGRGTGTGGGGGATSRCGVAGPSSPDSRYAAHAGATANPISVSSVAARVFFASIA